MTSSLRRAICFALLVGWVGVAHADFPPEWDRRQAEENGWIYDDFESAVAKAKETGKPMMVVLRCPP